MHAEFADNFERAFGDDRIEHKARFGHFQFEQMRRKPGFFYPISNACLKAVLNYQEKFPSAVIREVSEREDILPD